MLYYDSQLVSRREQDAKGRCEGEDTNAKRMGCSDARDRPRHERHTTDRAAAATVDEVEVPHREAGLTIYDLEIYDLRLGSS